MEMQAFTQADLDLRPEDTDDEALYEVLNPFLYYPDPP